MPAQITLNGARVPVDAPEDMPLLWVLRDLLHLTGTKFGCGVGQCAACTVLLDGRPVRSCVTPLRRAVGHEVTTIEGLAGDGALHPVQEAWIAEQVVQCGGCQPGMILGAAALLARTPHPTDREIDEALGSHLCRCGTYQRIRRAVHRAAGEVE